MSQYDFGTIDPYVVDGVTLASMLNQWRDAIHSMHRGAARPSYAVPGMMWINDSAGPTAWVVNVYMGPAIGDRALFQYNTSTGVITQVADQVTAALLQATAAANPAFQLTAGGNAANQRTWRGVVLPSGVLQFQALNDAGAVLQSLDLNRDGTMRLVAPAAGDASSLVPTTQWVRDLVTATGSKLLQRKVFQTGESFSTSTPIPWDDTIPQIGEGSPLMSLAITPIRADSFLDVTATVNFSVNAASLIVVSMFRDAVVNAFAASTAMGPQAGGTAGYPMPMVATGRIPSTSSTPTTISVRFGTSGTATVNINGSAGAGYARLFGGLQWTSLRIDEVMA